MALSQEELSLILRRLVHDLRGPLINLRMSLDVLVALEDASERQSLSVEMDRELARLDLLIEDTAQLAQAAQCHLADVSLNAVLAQFLHGLDQPDGVRLSTALEEGCRATLDVDKLLRLLGLLLAEAHDNLGSGGRIHLELARSQEYFEIRLEDDGPPPAPAVPVLPTTGKAKIDLREAFVRLVLDGHGAELVRGLSRWGGRAAILRLPAKTVAS